MSNPFMWPINYGDQNKPDTTKADIDWLGAIGKQQSGILLGYNLNPDEGYGNHMTFSDGSHGKYTNLSWYDGIAIENLTVDDVAEEELRFHLLGAPPS